MKNKLKSSKNKANCIFTLSAIPKWVSSIILQKNDSLINFKKRKKKKKHCNTLLLYWDYFLMNETNKELHGNSPRQVTSCNYWRYFSINNLIFRTLLLFSTIATVTLHYRKATETTEETFQGTL